MYENLVNTSIFLNVVDFQRNVQKVIQSFSYEFWHFFYIKAYTTLCLSLTIAFTKLFMSKSLFKSIC